MNRGSARNRDRTAKRDTARWQNEALLDSVYRRYSADVAAYALRRSSPDDAADVVSETFVVAWRRIGDIPDEPAVKPWLLGVARRVLANQRRGVRRRGALVEKVSAHLAPHLRSAPAIEPQGDAHLVTEALNRLSAGDRELLTLIAWDELTPIEVATALGISPATVRTRLFRARKRLAAASEKLDGERLPESGHLPTKKGATRFQMGEGATT